jgi:hypothetical protein
MLETPSIRRYSFLSDPFEGDDMSSDNPSGAVNQQERPDLSGWMDRIPTTWATRSPDSSMEREASNVPIHRDLSSIQAGIPARFEGILSARGPMNDGGRRRRSDDVVYRCVEELGILRGHTQSSAVEARG